MTSTLESSTVAGVKTAVNHRSRVLAPPTRHAHRRPLAV